MIKIYNRAGDLHYENTEPITNSTVIIDSSAKNYEGTTQRLQREYVTIESCIEEPGTRSKRKKYKQQDDYGNQNYQEEVYYPSRHDRHWQQDRPYGMFTPVVEGIAQMLREFRTRYADDLTYRVLCWSVSAGAIATVAGALYGVNYVTSKIENIPSIESVLQVQNH